MTSDSFRFSENFEQSHVVDLQSELKVLIHVGRNENIVNILGACTKGLCIRYLSFYFNVKDRDINHDATRSQSRVQ